MNDEFRILAEQLIKYLCENHHPHTTIIITPTSAEIVEGVKAFTEYRFLKD